MFKKIAITLFMECLGGAASGCFAARNTSSYSESMLVQETKPEAIFVAITSIYYSHYNHYISSLFEWVTGNNSSSVTRLTFQ